MSAPVEIPLASVADWQLIGLTVFIGFIIFAPAGLILLMGYLEEVGRTERNK